MSKRKILIVEDDQDVLLGLSIRLKASGYSVVSATDAAWATTVARKEKPDLAIVDLGLPGGNGFLVIERLRSIMDVHIPIIVLTAWDPTINKERAFKAGVEAFFQKPVDNDEFLAAIHKALGKSG
ncbi:MAG: hypothetical protein A2V51_01235 [Candidatus Dadabacteria bacterium RBG_19FT_COMBO_40_33]|nr:MAG: hypothetical protein A2V51_01235 [Candidatus Dadabacteria bacterium RBG_19FT_COMBO_40_33]